MAANNRILNYIINNAPIMRSDVCKALSVKGYAVTESVTYIQRYEDQLAYKITSESIGKDVRYAVKASPFSLAQKFIRNRKNVLQAKRTKTNGNTSKANASHG